MYQGLKGIMNVEVGQNRCQDASLFSEKRG